MFLEQAQRPPGQMVRPKGVLEARVRRARVHEKGQAELSNVPEALKGRGIDQLERQRVEPDVVPQRIANDLDGHTGMIRLIDAWCLDRNAIGGNNSTQVA